MRLIFASWALLAVAASATPIVIAHRGASGYVPEHTLAAASMAIAMGADFVEPDVVLTKDGVPVVLHDIHLESTTDVATRFPSRKRDDGRWYAIDFTLAEIKTLVVGERLDTKTGHAVFPKRFPENIRIFQVPTLAEVASLVQGAAHSTGRDVGLYPELKAPAFHRAEGKNIAAATFAVLEKTGWSAKPKSVFLQCFDPAELQRLRREEKPPYRFIQLIGDNAWKEADTNYEAMRTKEGLKLVRSYADGVGIWIPYLYEKGRNPGAFAKDAHAQGLLVHAYSLRAEELPEGFPTLEALAQSLFTQVRIDGLFSDFPDRARAVVASLSLHRKSRVLPYSP